MPTPTVIAEKYVGQTGGTVSLGGVTLHVIAGGDDEREASTDDLTGTTSGGFYEDTSCIHKASGSFTYAWTSSSPPPEFQEGSLYAMIRDQGGTTPYFSGTVRVNKVKNQTVNVKEGIKIMITWTSFGTFSRTRP